MKTTQYQFELPENMKRDAQKKCLDENVRLAAVMRGLMQQWLAGEIPTPEPEAQEASNERSTG